MTDWGRGEAGGKFSWDPQMVSRQPFVPCWQFLNSRECCAEKSAEGLSTILSRLLGLFLNPQAPGERT